MLPLTTRLEQTFGERVRRLPGPARALLLVAAAESTGDPAVVLRAGARLGAGTGALAEAEAAGLVRTGDGRLAFRHPLVRSAAYQTGTLAARQAAHRALAEVLAGEDAADQRAWHLAAATVGPDEEAAAGLERSADRARRRGGHAAAAAALERAAGLTGDDHERGRRLAAAATAAWLAGQADRAAALLDRAEPLASDPRGQAAVAHLRGSIEASRGIALHAAAMLIAGSELAAAVDPSQALQMLVEASEIASYAGDVTPTAELGRRAAALPVADKAGEFLSDLLQGMGRVGRGRRRRRRAAAAPGHRACRAPWSSRAGCSGPGWPPSSWASTTPATPCTRGPWPGPGRRARSGCCPWRWSTWPRSSWPPAATTRPPPAPPRACAWPARPATTPAPAGTWPPWPTWPPCRATRRPAGPAPPRRWTGPPPAAWGCSRPWPATPSPCSTWGRAGPPRRWPGSSACWPPARAPAAPSSPSTPCPTWSRRPSGAASRRPRPPPWPPSGSSRPPGSQEVLAQLARCRGLAGPDEEAADRFEEALALHDGQGRPFDLARTELAYGEALRRAKRRGEARTHLRSALETFQRLGAAPWAERATAELRATGETARKRDPSTLSQLTPQELQIIRLVGEGGTNREIGAQLFLSRRTIDYHLRNVFVKLGVSSRAELIRLAMADR